MRRIIIKEFEHLSDELSSFSGMFAYRLKNLCIKAEEVSLLPVQVMIEGELQNLEKCTILAKKDDYSFMVFPKYDEDMSALQQGIMAVHPEFKQSIETMKVDTADENGNVTQTDARYVLLTMPEVDDDRYDLLKNGVKFAYDECNAQMAYANTKADAKIAELTVGETEENMNLIKQEREKLNQQWDEHRDKLYNTKLQEIEDAHNKWLAEKAEHDQKRQEEEAARGESAAYSMKLGQEDIN